MNACELRKFGLRRGAYNGATRRRFCLFESLGNGLEMRREFDTRRERETTLERLYNERIRQSHDSERGDSPT